MTRNTKKVAIFAVLITLLIGLIPANIAWAGQLWQGTLPTVDLSATPIVFRTTAAPQNTATGL